MSGRIRRSAVAAVRISLISGGAALSWLALSAGTATADDGGERTSIGSVTSVVESVGTPMESVIQEVSAPLDSVNAVAPASPTQIGKVSNHVSAAPEIVANISVIDTVAPVTDLADAGVSQVPVVNAVVPQGTTTAVTQPVLEIVDSAVAPVLPPVQEVAAPVVEVLVPVAETLDPVVEVVEPILDPAAVIDPVAPVITLPELADVEEPAEPQSAPAQAAAAGAAAGAAFSSVQLAEDLPVPADAASPPSQAADYALQEAPQLALGSAQPTVDSPDSPAILSGAGAGSSGSLGSGSVGAADTPSFFNFDIPSCLVSQSGYSAALPHGPSFDPGSTPD